MMEDDNYFQPSRIIQRLQTILEHRVEGDYKIWFKGYLKNVTPVRGVRMLGIRHSVHRWHVEWEAEQQTIPFELQLTVALQLFESEYLEDQLASILYLDEVLIQSDRVTPDTLQYFERLFQRHHITNFKISDYFSAKVLQPMIIRYKDQVPQLLQNWFDAPSVWQARAALAALIPFASDAIFEDILLAGCRKLVIRPEEDAKKVVGSALYALGKRSTDIVENFLAEDVHLACIGAAALTKAARGLANGRAKELRARRKILVQQGVVAPAQMQTVVPIAVRNEAGAGSSGKQHDGQGQGQEESAAAPMDTTGGRSHEWINEEDYGAGEGEMGGEWDEIEGNWQQQ